MPCEQPIEAYRATQGGPICFKRPQQQTYETLQLPCGHCILCRLEQGRQNAVRIHHEAHGYETSSFITLTYDDKHLPQYGSLQYDDLQRFWKRLRKKIGKFRYFAVGEYGDQTQRPHYHACVFGEDFTKDGQIIRRLPTQLWTSKLLEECWGLGLVSVGALTFETAQYTASYVTKKLKSKKQYVRLETTTGELIPLVQPRAFMSKAIGRRWLALFGNAVYAHDYVVINGKKQKPPKAYDRWLKERSEIAMQMIKEQRKQRAQKQTSEQLRARARNAHARAKNRNKRL